MELERRCGNLLVGSCVPYVGETRTTIGWKGFALRPGPGLAVVIGSGLALSRRLMLDLTAMGLPSRYELLQAHRLRAIWTICVGWAAIGAPVLTLSPDPTGRCVSGLVLRFGLQKWH